MSSNVVGQFYLVKCLAILLDSFIFVKCLAILTESFILVECLATLLDSFILVECLPMYVTVSFCLSIHLFIVQRLCISF